MSDGTKRKRDEGRDLPVITYHAESRTFDRLFKEKSLEEMKEVVRRKLGLDREALVQLKQIRMGKLVDLEDDDDFDAFRSFARTPAHSVDVQVTVGGPAPPRPISEIAPAARRPSDVALSIPEIVNDMRTATTPEPVEAQKKAKVPAQEPEKETEEPAKPVKKRKKASEKEKEKEKEAGPSVVRPAPESPKAGAKRVPPPIVTEEPTSPKPTGVEKAVEGPPKKKRKVTKSEEVPPTHDGEPFGKRKDAEASKPEKKKDRKVPKSAEVETVEPSEPPEKPKKKKKRTDETDPPSEPAVSSAGAGLVPGGETGPGPQTHDGRVESTPEENTPQPALPKSAKHKATTEVVVETSGKKPKRSSKAKDETHATASSSTGLMSALDIKDILASIAASRSGSNKSRIEQSESSEQPKRPTRPRKSTSNKVTIVRSASPTELASVTDTRPAPEAHTTIPSKVTPDDTDASSPKSPVSPTAALSESTSKKVDAVPMSLPSEEVPILDTPAQDVAMSPEVTSHDAETTSPKPPFTSSTTLPCPICLQQPFHIRYYCPVVLKGPTALEERLNEIRKSATDDDQFLIKELEVLIRRASDRAGAAPKSNPALAAGPSRESSALADVSLPRTPAIPGGSYLSEVTVESRDEGSESSESPEPEIQDEEADVSQGPDEQQSFAEDDLAAIIRGPAPRKSILKLLDTTPSDDDAGELGEGDLEEDQEEDRTGGREFRRLSGQMNGSSDEDAGEDETESRSPSVRVDQSVASATSTDAVNQLLPENDPADESRASQGEADGRSIVPGSGDDSDKTQVEPEASAGPVLREPEASGTGKETSHNSSAPENLGASSSEQLGASRDGPGAVEDENADHLSGNQVTTDEPNDADPIEPADDLEHVPSVHAETADPIESGSPVPEEVESMFMKASQSTPKPGLSRQMKTRGGVIPDKGDLPVLLADLEVGNSTTPVLGSARSTRRTRSVMASQVTASQESVATRRSTRNAIPPPSTAKGSQFPKTPAKMTEQRLSQKSTKSGTSKKIAATPSMVSWETMREPTPSILFDELESSSPQPGDHAALENARSAREAGHSDQEGSSEKKKERLFDLTESQIPFPYSQHSGPPVAALQEQEVSSESEEERPVPRKQLPRRTTRQSVPYRRLSQLASEASFFSPSLTAPPTSGQNGKAKRKRVADDDDDEEESSSSDSDDEKKSVHIPRARRAGSVLQSKRKKVVSRLRG